MAKVCGTCQYWFDAKGGGTDECRIRAPIVSIDGTEALFPPRCVDDLACGEHKERII